MKKVGPDAMWHPALYRLNAKNHYQNRPAPRPGPPIGPCMPPMPGPRIPQGLGPMGGRRHMPGMPQKPKGR